MSASPPSEQAPCHSLRNASLIPQVLDLIVTKVRTDHIHFWQIKERRRYRCDLCNGVFCKPFTSLTDI